MTKILYLANIRLPTEKAHGLQIMKTCEALAVAGTDVELVVPCRKSKIVEDPFSYYGIRMRFPVTTIGVPDTVAYGIPGFLLESFVFAYRAALLARKKKYNILYSRDELVLWIAHSMGCKNIVWESHTGSWNVFARGVARVAKYIVVISDGLKDFYTARGVGAKNLIVARDGIDLADFAQIESMTEARMRLGLPQDKKIALYAGRLDGWKGSATFLEAARFLPNCVRFAVIGGEPEQVAALSKKYPKVLFLGYRPYRELPQNMAAADLLALPNTAADVISARFTSPLKLFAYMTSDKPIVVSDLPSIREVLDETCAYFFTPDNSQDLVRAVMQVLGDPRTAGERGRAARQKAEAYSWNTRATYILAGCEGLT